ncbi:hypothetical protein EAG_11734 [Camponotus floridanus]|uniref:Uncharacterized protein n=1 Tax=Camponotus floridanus TaxID=104421 RepID=E2AYG3_CAMFO|nr:hypothetical protein EAG_11734 [Camponotus floridanus]
MWSSPGQACNFMPRVFEILNDEVCHGIRGLQPVTKQALRVPEFTHESRHPPLPSPSAIRERTNVNATSKTLSSTPTTRYETDKLPQGQ